MIKFLPLDFNLYETPALRYVWINLTEGQVLKNASSF